VKYFGSGMLKRHVVHNDPMQQRTESDIVSECRQLRYRRLECVLRDLLGVLMRTDNPYWVRRHSRPPVKAEAPTIGICHQHLQLFGIARYELQRRPVPDTACVGRRICGRQRRTPQSL